jgi:hypothetical protein
MNLADFTIKDPQYIEERFLGFFNGQGNNYAGALDYFHTLEKEGQDFIRKHPVLGTKLDLAIDEVMYGNMGDNR